jgi:hypothetical protein
MVEDPASYIPCFLPSPLVVEITEVPAEAQGEPPNGFVAEISVEFQSYRNFYVGAVKYIRTSRSTKRFALQRLWRPFGRSLKLKTGGTFSAYIWNLFMAALFCRA